MPETKQREEDRVRVPTKEVEQAMRSLGYTRGGYVKGRFLFQAPDGKRVNLSLSEARTLTGIEAPKRAARERVPVWGDWEAVAALNKVKPHA
jgi:hypothetical protein